MLVINNQFIFQASSSVAPLEGWDPGQDSLCPDPPSPARTGAQTQNREWRCVKSNVTIEQLKCNQLTRIEELTQAFLPDNYCKRTVH